jgi:hypothetical protein
VRPVPENVAPLIEPLDSPQPAFATVGFVVRVGGVDGFVTVYGPKVATQPLAFVAVRVYAPAGKFVKVAVEPIEAPEAVVQL